MRKKLLCAVMCCVLICGTFVPKRAYAVAGVDDAAVVIVCALLAAAGVTFATNDGVQDAVQGFLDASGGKYDSTIERIANGYNVYGSVGAFKIPTMAMGGVRLLLEGLFDYFSVDDSRQGNVTVSGGGGLGFIYLASTDDPVVIDFFDLKISNNNSPVYVFSYCSPYTNSSGKFVPNIYYVFISCSPFSYSFFNTDTGKLVSGTAGSNAVSFLKFYDPWVTVYCKTTYMADYENDYSSLFGLPYTSLVSCSGSPSEDVSLRPMFSAIVENDFPDTEKSIPYGLTFPDDLSAPDVIDNFEQRVEAAAGDLAITVPVDGVIDNTLPYAEAQEQYLTNVNELGEITDTVTESNTWLQKILTAVKALPATVIGTGSLDFSCFSDIGLSSVFPFCIPFDLKNALVGFNVTPADPIWEISFDGTFMSAAGSYILDMTKFEKLFAVVRFFIYGGFVVSLILLTRKIIKG